MRHPEDERRPDLAVGRVQVQSFVIGRLDVADVPGLQPERRACEVIVQRVPSVRRRAEVQRSHIGERKDDRKEEEDESPVSRDLGQNRPAERRQSPASGEQPRAARRDEEHGRATDQRPLRDVLRGGQK